MPNCYSKLDSSLQEILGRIRIHKYEKKRNNIVFLAELNAVIHRMQLDPVFNTVYRNLSYGGSTYENLKICFPNEYDINVELCLPFGTGENFKISDSKEPGFVTLTVHDFDEALYFENNIVRRTVKSWFDSKGRLLRTKVYQWMHGVFDRTMYGYKSENQVQIMRSNSGPAITLALLRPKCATLCVDLSPVFCFMFDELPRRRGRQYSDIPHMTSMTWYAVPKAPHTYSSSPELWRTSFYRVEKRIMNGQQQLKAVLKLMKCLRDVQDWQGLSSYYIKTIFLWELHKEGSEIWRESLGELFLHMLGVMQTYLAKGNIPFFWDERYNLLRRLDPDFRKNTAQRILKMKKTILSNVDRRPETVLVYFMKRIPHQHEDGIMDFVKQLICVLLIIAFFYFIGSEQNNNREL